MNRTRANLAVIGLVLSRRCSTWFDGVDANKAVARLGMWTLLGRVVNSIATTTDHSPIITVPIPAQRGMYAESLIDWDMISAFKVSATGVFSAVKFLNALWLDISLLSSAAIKWLIDWLTDSFNASSSALDVFTMRYPDGMVDPLYTLYRQSAVEYIRKHISMANGPYTLFVSHDSIQTVEVDVAPVDVSVKS